MENNGIVDAYTGATFAQITRTAVLTAVMEALRNAGVNQEDYIRDTEEEAPADDMTKDLAVEEQTKLIPVGRFGKPEEVAALAAFLASDEAGYITGEVININGGLYT